MNDKIKAEGRIFLFFYAMQNWRGFCLGMEKK